MAGRYFLALRGRVEYFPAFQEIECKSGAECFTIMLDASTKVTTRGSRKQSDLLRRHIRYTGDELLANGRRYWVRQSKEQGSAKRDRICVI
jgi:hypothetical protein